MSPSHAYLGQAEHLAHYRADAQRRRDAQLWQQGRVDLRYVKAQFPQWAHRSAWNAEKQNIEGSGRKGYGDNPFSQDLRTERCLMLLTLSKHALQ